MTQDPAIDATGETTFWYAHDHPEKPFDGGVLLCECPACGLAVTAASHAEPAFALVVRGEITRRLVTITEAAVAALWGGLAGLLPGDHLRDIGAAVRSTEIAENQPGRSPLAAMARLDRATGPDARPCIVPEVEPHNSFGYPPSDGLGL